MQALITPWRAPLLGELAGGVGETTSRSQTVPSSGWQCGLASSSGAGGCHTPVPREVVRLAGEARSAVTNCRTAAVGCSGASLVRVGGVGRNSPSARGGFSAAGRWTAARGGEERPGKADCGAAARPRVESSLVKRRAVARRPRPGRNARRGGPRGQHGRLLFPAACSWIGPGVPSCNAGSGSALGGSRLAERRGKKQRFHRERAAAPQ